MQFAEKDGHGHVHFHIVPRMADIPEENKGPKVFNYLGVIESDCVREEIRDEIALRMREKLAAT